MSCETDEWRAKGHGGGESVDGEERRSPVEWRWIFQDCATIKSTVEGILST
jgi:hypothetical protein